MITNKRSRGGLKQTGLNWLNLMWGNRKASHDWDLLCSLQRRRNSEKTQSSISREDGLHSKWDIGRKMGRFCSCMQQNSRLAIECLVAKQLYISSFCNAPWRSIALGWLICFVLFPCYQSTRLQAGKLLCCVRFYPKISGEIDFTLQNTGERERAKGRRLLPTSP